MRKEFAPVRVANLSTNMLGGITRSNQCKCPTEILAEVRINKLLDEELVDESSAEFKQLAITLEYSVSRHFCLRLSLGADSPSKGVWKYVAIGVAAVAVVMVCGICVIWKKRASSTRRKDPNEMDIGSQVNFAMTERLAAEETPGEVRSVEEKSAV